MDDFFEANRATLFGVAYRMLGTRADTQDVLLEAAQRWEGVESSALENPRGYLFRLVVNEAIEQLRRAEPTREQYVGPWLPEPLIDDAAADAELAGSGSVGLLVALETLRPDERAVYVLHEAFGFDFPEIAGMLGRGERAARQLAESARARVAEVRVRERPATGEFGALTERFVGAAVGGDVSLVTRLLAPDAVLYADSDGQWETPKEPLHGAAAVTEWFRVAAGLWPERLTVRTTTVNGGPGALVLAGGTPFVVLALECDEDEHVAGVYAMFNPEKLPRAARFG